VSGDVVLDRVTLLADDVGRLRRRLPPDTLYTGWLVERLGDHVDVLDAMLRPTAGELVAAGVPVKEALHQVDQDRARLRQRLGLDAIVEAGPLPPLKGGCG
jgi:hypothetical protein